MQQHTQHKHSKNLLNEDWKCLLSFLKQLICLTLLVISHCACVSECSVTCMDSSCQAWLCMYSLCSFGLLHTLPLGRKSQYGPYCQSCVTQERTGSACAFPVAWPGSQAQGLRAGVGMDTWSSPDPSHFYFTAFRFF